MLNIIGLNIEINRGNAAGLTFHFDGDDKPADGTEVIFQVEPYDHKGEPIIEKTATVAEGAVTVDFVPGDTEEIEPGLYCWNACIQYDGGSEPWTVLRDWQRFSVLPG